MPLDRKRVVWFEGMTLDPHHFQQFDRYVQGTINARVRALSSFDWGVSGLEIDRERLANGEFVVVRAGGVMPDGLWFDMPDSDEPPTPRNVQEYFPATASRLEVFLVTPVERSDGSNFLLQDSENRRETRFRAETIVVQDENTGANTRQVEVGRSNFQIRFGGESLHEYTTIQIAEVRRSSSGAFVLNEEFVPACVTVASSARLMALTRRLLEMMVAKSAPLLDRQRGVAKQREVSPADVIALERLGTLHTYIPVLDHYLGLGSNPPEDLYRTLLSLAGRLTACLPESTFDLSTFPAYDHANLTGCFNRLNQILLELLALLEGQANYIEIPLHLQRENLYTAVLDDDLLQNAQFFLVARSDVFDEATLVEELPKGLRVASPDMIERVLQSYTRALIVQHTHRLPAALPVDQQANYFQLQKHGPFWEAICDTKGIAIFMPHTFSGVSLKLVAVEAP